MGLSIFYGGRLRHSFQLRPLLTETTDICEQLAWAHDVFQPTRDIPLQGMWMAPPGCDQVWLTFTFEGFLASPVSYITHEPHPRRARHTTDCYMTDTITQFGGPDLHMHLVDLLRYLARKHMASFTMTDESEYWETRDPVRCRDWFDMFSVWMDRMSADVGRLDGQGDKPGHTVYERVAELVRNGRLKEWIMLTHDPFMLRK